MQKEQLASTSENKRPTSQLHKDSMKFYIITDVRYEGHRERLKLTVLRKLMKTVL